VTAFAGRTEIAPDQRRARLGDLAPSAKLVFKTLEIEAPLTQSEIAERSRLSKRTTRHALSELGDADLVEEAVSLQDARIRLYTPRPIAEGPPD
jgi:DNA-binding MarR family transcriptional regulator